MGALEGISFEMKPQQGLLLREMEVIVTIIETPPYICRSLNNERSLFGLGTISMNLRHARFAMS